MEKETVARGNVLQGGSRLEAPGRRLPTIIAIDGPAASGKSTVGNALARRLDYLYFDTGVMYRAVTWRALAADIAVSDQGAVAKLAESLLIEVKPADPTETDGRQSTVMADGEDVTWAIRTPEVDRNVSAVSAVPRVRSALTAQQRRIGLRYAPQALAHQPQAKAGIVMVGRDVGTVVLPEAPVKFYLDAPVTERARRRYQELQARGKVVAYPQVLADMRRRDQIDSERAVAPLRVAADAVVVQTADLEPQQVVAAILTLLEKGHDQTQPVA